MRRSSSPSRPPSARPGRDTPHDHFEAAYTFGYTPLAEEEALVEPDDTNGIPNANDIVMPRATSASITWRGWWPPLNGPPYPLDIRAKSHAEHERE